MGRWYKNNDVVISLSGSLSKVMEIFPFMRFMGTHNEVWKYELLVYTQTIENETIIGLRDAVDTR